MIEIVRQVKSILAAVICCVFSYNLCNAAGLFLSYQAFSTGYRPEAVAIGDVNNDKKNDVVITTSKYFDPPNDYHLHLFLQNDSGRLNSRIKYPAGNGESVDIGDVNNDGKNDVVVTANNSVGVLLQNDSGGLDSMVTYVSHITQTYKLRVADLNNDGLSDVVVIGWTAGIAEVFHQNIGGTLDSPVAYPVLYGGYTDLDVGDVNNDNLTDIVISNGQMQTTDISVLLQNADGTFGSPIYYDTGIDKPNGVAVGDVNNDALNDIVVSYGGNTPSSFIGTFIQNTFGTLDSIVSYPSYDIPRPIDISDVNLDGKNDVIVLHSGWKKMGVFRQGEEGRLLPYELYSLPYSGYFNPHGLAIGDINQDGANDVAYADQNRGLVILYHASKKPEISSFSWPMFMPAIIGKSCKINSFWGAYSIVCCRSSSATFSITIDGKTKRSYKPACGVKATFEGWEKTSAGKKSVYWQLTSPNCGTYGGTFPWVMEKGRVYLFRIELENRKLIVYVYSGDACNVVQNAKLTKSPSLLENKVEMETESLQLVNKIELDIPPDTFQINDLPVDSSRTVP